MARLPRCTVTLQCVHNSSANGTNSAPAISRYCHRCRSQQHQMPSARGSSGPPAHIPRNQPRRPYRNLLRQTRQIAVLRCVPAASASLPPSLCEACLPSFCRVGGLRVAFRVLSVRMLFGACVYVRFLFDVCMRAMRVRCVYVLN